MNDHIRVSDADRERVADRLREHFAEGRLTSDELDERITAALSAKTFGDLRRVMADLPEPGRAPGSRPGLAAVGAAARAAVRRRGPRILPLALLVLIAALVIPGAAGCCSPSSRSSWWSGWWPAWPRSSRPSGSAAGCGGTGSSSTASTSPGTGRPGTCGIRPDLGDRGRHGIPGPAMRAQCVSALPHPCRPPGARGPHS